MQDSLPTRYIPAICKYKGKVMDVIGREGFTGLIKKAIKIVARHLFAYNKLAIYEIHLGKLLKPFEVKVDLVFKNAPISDIQAMDKESYNSSVKNRISPLRRLEEGDKSILGLHGERIVGFIWAVNGFMELSQFHL